IPSERGEPIMVATANTVREIVTLEPSQGDTSPSPFYRDLEPFAQFVNYQRADKTPWSFSGNRAIDATRPENGLPLAEVIKAVEGSRFLGVGFILSAETRLAVIDLDRCVVGGKLTTTAQITRAQFPQAYVEYSPSGNGLHLWLRLSAPYNGRNRKDHDLGIEASFANQYVTLTDNRLEDSPATIGDVSLEIFETWMRSQFGDDIASLKQWPDPVTPDYSDGRVLELLFAGNFADDIKALWNGDLSEYGGDHSKCDYHLVRHITFYTQDFEQIDRLFRESELMRDKWDEMHGALSYGVDTILDAMAARVQSGIYYASDVRNGGVRTASGSRKQTSTGGTDTNPSDGFRAIPRSQWGTIPRPAWLLDQMLIAGKVNLLYGKSSTFKSFIAFHMAAAIASGTPCFGFDCVSPGAVFWIAAEGEDSLHPMALAWETEFNNGTPIPDAHFAQLPYRVNLSGDHDLQRTQAEMQDVFLADTPIRLIVVDTLSRTFEGEQNSNDDGAAYIRQLEKLAEDTGSAVLLIHHGSKYGDGPRGAYAFFADSTLVIHQERPDADKSEAKLTWEKSRGQKQPEPLHVFGKSVSYGSGSEEASLVFKSQVDRIPALKSQQDALRALKACNAGMTFTEWESASGLAETTFKRALKALVEGQFVTQDGDHYVYQMSA
ncbi:MAG: AAA family ATPase, partial [Solirubrobacterales bacterium]